VKRLEAGQPKNQGSIPSKNKRVLDPKKSRLALLPTQPPFPMSIISSSTRVKQLGPEATQSLPSRGC